MVRVFVRHEVADYAIWRHHYDTFHAERRAMGVIGDNVFRNAEDDHEITVTYDFQTLAEAQQFMSPRHLNEAKSVSGGPAEPSIWIAEL